MNWQRFFLMVGLLVLSGCGDTIEPGRSDLPDRGSVALPVMTLTDVVETSSESFVGTHRKSGSGGAGGPRQRQIDSFRVREGDRVTQGQLLVAVGDDPLRDQLAVAEAAYRAAETQAAAARARLTLAEQTTQRYQQLWANEAITAQDTIRSRPSWRSPASNWPVPKPDCSRLRPPALRHRGRAALAGFTRRLPDRC